MERAIVRTECSLIYIAARFGMSTWVRHLLSSEEDSIRQKAINDVAACGANLLTCAIRENHVETVKVLLEHGATSDHDAFVSAFGSERENALKLLIQHGNPNVTGEMDILGELSKYFPVSVLNQALCADDWRVSQLLVGGGAVAGNLSSCLEDASKSSVNPKFLHRILQDDPTIERILTAILGAMSSVHPLLD